MGNARRDTRGVAPRSGVASFLVMLPFLGALALGWILTSKRTHRENNPLYNCPHNRAHSLSAVLWIALTQVTVSSASHAQGQVQFKDVTSEAGIRMLQNDPHSTGTGEVRMMTGGATAGDFDGDGWVDLFVTSFDRSAHLFLNMGANANGEHQGFVDVAQTAFTPGPPGKLSNGAASADIDGDGDLDLYVTSLSTFRYQLWINDGAGNFTEQALSRGAGIASPRRHKGFSASFGDYDRDGYLDLFVAEWGKVNPVGVTTPSHARLLRNLGAAQPGHFIDVTSQAGVSVDNIQASGPSGSFAGVYAFTPRFADLDNDGRCDLAIAGDFHTSRLFWNNGDSTFEDGTLAAGVGTDENGMGATIGDFNRDGNLDWFVTSIFDSAPNCGTGCNWDVTGNRLYLNRGSRQFVDGTSAARVRNGGWGWAPVALDFDNDGQLDLAMTNGIVFDNFSAEDAYNFDPMKLWHNTPTGFVEVSSTVGLADTGSGKGLLRLDYDRDGDLDLFVCNNSATPILYRNDGGNKLGWLQITLQANGPNVFGIGARIRVWPELADEPIVHEMSASSNYLSQDECLAHFGLNQDAAVSKIEVRWPDGTTTEWLDLLANQRIVLDQP